MSLIPDPAFLFRPLTRQEKGCDDGCIGAECSHPTCHHGFPSILLPCEGCDHQFCRDHLTPVHTFRLCPDCYSREAQEAMRLDTATADDSVKPPCVSLAEQEREYDRWQEGLMNQ